MIILFCFLGLWPQSQEVDSACRPQQEVVQSGSKNDQDQKKQTVVIRTTEAVAKLPASTKVVHIKMRKKDDVEIIQKLLEVVPNLESLRLDHPANGFPYKSFALLKKFKKMDSLFLEGDFYTDAQVLEEIGNLTKLKSLRLRAP